MMKDCMEAREQDREIQAQRGRERGGVRRERQADRERPQRGEVGGAENSPGFL